jgi:osmotically-inducible protein OsmY
MIDFARRVPPAAILLAAALGAFACSTPDDRTPHERAADRSITRLVVAALLDDPYVDADHIDVVTRRGVVRLSGLVASDRDLREALRVSAGVRGVLRVEDDLEMIKDPRPE